MLATLQGRGTAGEEFIIYTLRLPRALTAVLAGAAFGASGAVYQSVTRNPLGSPDIIGFTYGASFGAVLAIVVLGTSDTAVTVAALAGGLAVAGLVYVLAYRGGGVSGYRLILVGIGISSCSRRSISYLLMKADIVDAQEAVRLAGRQPQRPRLDRRPDRAGRAARPRAAPGRAGPGAADGRDGRRRGPGARASTWSATGSRPGPRCRCSARWRSSAPARSPSSPSPPPRSPGG